MVNIVDSTEVKNYRIVLNEVKINKYVGDMVKKSVLENIATNIKHIGKVDSYYIWVTVQKVREATAGEIGYIEEEPTSLPLGYIYKDEPLTGDCTVTFGGANLGICIKSMVRKAADGAVTVDDECAGTIGCYDVYVSLNRKWKV